MVFVDTDKVERTNKERPGAADLILAHELSHVLQFRADSHLVDQLCAGTLGSVKIYELLADFGAGYTMFRTMAQGTNSREIFARTIASLADYEFTSVVHHGTVTERLNAFDMGQASAYFNRKLDMSALLRNQVAFMSLLAGPPLPALAAGTTTYENYARDALNQVYK